MVDNIRLATTELNQISISTKFTITKSCSNIDMVQIIFSEVIRENLVCRSNSSGVWGSAVSSPIGDLEPKCYPNARK